MNEKMLEMTMISLDDGVVMPELSFYLDATTREACEAVGHAVKNEECIFLANPVHKNGDKTVSFYEIGVIARIKQFVRLQNKGMRVLIQTEKRARLVDYSKDKYYVCHVTDVEETNDISEDEEKAIQSILKEKLKEAFDEGIVKNNVLYREIRSFKSVRKLVDSMADYVNISDDNRQELLEMLDVRSRAMRLIQIMEEVLGIGKIKKEIMEKVNQETAENQRKYVLREQMSVIRKELGDDGVDANVREFQKRLDEAGCSQEVYDKIEKEINYYKGIPQNAVESSVSANYIDVMLSYPWNVSTEDNNDLQSAIDILDKDHYGLEEVKERIVDYLAVHILSNKGDLPIICLVGPPGTGKTSIARSIARATSRKYVRLSLGGVHDEAEIRGHRKTYVGAMPGKIVQSMIKAKTNNPLMLLDEIDKVSSDYKGDVSSALLEVLDGEQNKEFNDHYFGVPVDLSNVLFIATANDLSGICLLYTSIVNEFLDHVTDYYGAQEVKVFSETLSNRALTVPVAAIAIGCVEIIILNIFLNTNMSVFWAVWFSLPVFILPLFFRLEPDVIYMFMVSTGLLGVICLKGNGHFRITDKDLSLIHI